MLHRRPKFGEQRAVGVAQSRQIIDQGVKPDIGHVVFIKGQGNAPGQAGLGPGNTQVLQGFFKKGKHFVAVAFGTDEIGVFLEVSDEPVLISAHAKEIIGFLDEGQRGLVVRTASVDDFPFRVKPLATDAILSAVFAEIDVPRFVDAR